MNDKTKQRIEEEAQKYGMKVMEKTKDSHDGINAKYAYIDGAETEHPRARNEAIEEVIQLYLSKDLTLETLEALKR